MAQVYNMNIQNRGRDPTWLSGKCPSRKPGVVGFEPLWILCFYFFPRGSGKTPQSPSLVLIKPRRDRNNVICLPDMTEILLTAP